MNPTFVHTRMRLRLRYLCGLLILTLIPAMLHAQPVSPPVSDDFSTGALNTSVWTTVDPVGDATFGMSATELFIGVPAGVDHDVWTAGNRAARVMQHAANTDFEVEVKFESIVSQPYQMQGILVEEDTANFIRFDFVSGPSGVTVFAATFVAGTPTVQSSTIIADGIPLFLRVRRIGNQWSHSYSFDTVTWQYGATFSHTIAVTAVGVFAGNAGASPAHTAVVDYFFNTASPITLEDGGLYTVRTHIDGQGSLETTPARQAYVFGEELQISASPDAGWAFERWTGTISSTSPTLSLTITGDVSLKARFVAEPRIVVWYGGLQSFGLLGTPQRSLNILGRLYLANGPSLAYRLNGGAERPLSIGPDGLRLERSGDFNIEIPYTELVSGANDITITATNSLGQVITEVVTLNHHPGNVWPLPYAIDWSTTVAIGDVAQVVDGQWELAEAGVRTSETGYDRLIAIGDLTWGSYEVTVPVTFHSINFLPHNQPLLGLFTAWRGHHDADGSQPSSGWWGSGGLGYYRWYAADNSSAALELAAAVNNSLGGAIVDQSFRMQPGITYVFRMRTEHVPGGPRTYALRVWQEGTPEPLSWQLTTSGPEPTSGGGSVLLVAHHVDATFGSPSIVPLSSDPPPVVSNVAAVDVTPTTARITWTTNQPATSIVEYGETTSYEIGLISETMLKSTHSVDLSGLHAGSVHHYRVASTASTGSTAISGDFMFVTPEGIAEPSVIVSDDFSETTLDRTIWTFVDPRFDASLEMTGTQAIIHVPGGVTHDVWTEGNFAPRLMQAANDTDFTIEAKFESPVNAMYQLQGLLVEQDTSSFIRFDAYWDGSSMALFGASFNVGTPTVRLNARIGGSAPVFLRIGRVASHWTLSHSANGADWQTAATFTQPVAVTAVGVFAGNAGSGAPAHSAVIDYFFNTAEPVVPEDDGRYSVRIDTVGNGTVIRNPDQPSYLEGEEVELAATPAAGWAFVGWSGDLTGSSTPTILVATRDHIVSAMFEDVAAPTIANIEATEITSTTATIKWTTNELATSAVYYGLTPAYEVGASQDQTLRIEHGILLSGLAPGTTYHYSVSSTDSSGFVAQSTDLTFTTAPPSTIVSDDFNDETVDTSVWTFVNPRQDATVQVTGTQAVIYVPAGVTHDVWTEGNFAPRLMQAANDADFTIEAKFESTPVTAYQLQGLLVEQDSGTFIRFDGYSDGAGLSLFAASFSAGAATIRANTRIPGDAPVYLRIARLGSQWTLLHSGDGVAWQTVALFTQPMVVTAAGLFAGNAGSAPAHSAVIDYFFNTASPIEPEDDGRFNLRIDVVGNGEVLRNPATTSYADGEQVELTAVPAVGWEFSSWGGDLSGSTSPAVLFVTRDHVVSATFTAVPDTTAPVIDHVDAATVGSTSATITWTTDEPATSAIDYGESTAYAAGTVQDETLTTTHSVVLTGLLPETTYHYRVRSADAAANVAEVDGLTFTTIAASTIVSDDFNDAELNAAVWTFVNPRQDASVSMTGTQAAIQVPGGVSHDAWTDGNYAPRLMQVANNTDFTIEAKFESPVTLAYQLQGLLVEQDANNFLRFDAYSDGAGVALFAATFSGGSATTHLNTRIATTPHVYLRVNRIGSQWTLSYSADGTSWQTATTFTRALTVATVGVFAGNAGTAPAHTAIIDYFFKH